MNQEQHDGDACPSYVNQDRNALPEVVLPTAVPTLVQLVEKRQLVAFRAMGTLIAMKSNGNIPEVHLTHVTRLIDEYEALTKAIEKEMS
jgi:hypothetical protein